jgi:hypothetical protein
MPPLLLLLRGGGRTPCAQAGPLNWFLPRKHSAPSRVGTTGLFQFSTQLLFLSLLKPNASQVRAPTIYA